MPSKRISKELINGTYFLTFTVKHWYYIFDRHNRWEIVMASLKYCQKNKGLQIYAYVLMLNHMHLLISAPDVSGFVRDFKKYTARKIYQNLEEKEPKVAHLFLGGEGQFSLWRKTNMPIPIFSESVYWQKRLYIENNPVKKRYVARPEDWIYSSAKVPNELVIDSPFAVG